MDLRIAEKRKKGYMNTRDGPHVGGKKNAKPILIAKPIPVESDDDFDYRNPTLPTKKQTPRVKALPKPEPTGRRIILD